MPGSIDSGGGQNRGTFAKYLSKVRNGAEAAIRITLGSQATSPLVELADALRLFVIESPET